MLSPNYKKPPRRVRRRGLALLAALCGGLLLFFALLWQTLSIGHFLDGLRQPAGAPTPGALPQAEGFTRWRETDEDALLFWDGGEATFAHGYARGALRFENAAACRYTLVFELTLERNGRQTVIYRSPPLPPGYCLDGDKLAVPLKRGVYNAQCVAYAYAEGAQTPQARSEARDFVITILE